MVLVSCKQNESIEKTEVSFPVERNHVAVFDFHNDHRCTSCVTIEKLSKETLNEFFKPELEDSTVVFSLVNVDLPENEKMAEEYEVYGTALMIVVFKDGEEDVLDLTDWAFEAIHGDDFKPEFKKEIELALNKL